MDEKVILEIWLKGKKYSEVCAFGHVVEVILKHLEKIKPGLRYENINASSPVSPHMADQGKIIYAKAFSQTQDDFVYNPNVGEFEFSYKFTKINTP